MPMQKISSKDAAALLKQAGAAIRNLVTENSTLKEKIADTKERNKTVMVRMGDKSFKCTCGCNVFTKDPAIPSVYKCNACETCYEGT